ncbi:MAG: thiamine phosphate synthase [Halofilum sp. (in: g-proteobacteria)]|nr:thiamine phosphate synthase [Halofilum sp. (in: g-proteobacteria)]
MRPVGPERLLSCACHDAAELAHAEALGADLAYLGSVAPTPSHPDAAPLGWEAFADLAAGTALPLYAIGGVTPSDLATARAAGAVGVAGIRGFWPEA